MAEVLINPEFTPWSFIADKDLVTTFIKSVTETTFRIIIFFNNEEKLQVQTIRLKDDLPEGFFHWDFKVETQKAIDGLENCQQFLTFVFKLFDLGYMLIMSGEGGEATLVKGSKISVSDHDVFLDKKDLRIGLIDHDSLKGSKIAII